MVTGYWVYDILYFKPWYFVLCNNKTDTKVQQNVCMFLKGRETGIEKYPGKDLWKAFNTVRIVDLIHQILLGKEEF